MNRILTAAVSLSLFCLASAPFAQGKTLKLSSTQPLTDPASKAQMDTLNKIIQEKTNGKYKISIATNGAFGTADAEFNAVMNGICAFAYQSTGNLTPINPLFGALDMPYMLTERDDIDYIFGNGSYERTAVGKKLLARMEELGAKILSVDLQSNRQMMTTIPLKNLEDAKGVKLRTTTSPAHINAIRALGMNPTPMSGAEVFPGIQQGLVAGADVNIFSIWTSRFCDLTKYVLYTDHLPAICVLYTSQKFWDSLSNEEQAVFSEAIAAYRTALPGYLEADAKMCVENALKEGVQFTELSQEEKARWIAAGQSALQDFSPELQGIIKEVQNTLGARNK